jgi:predicted metal-dependent peptidase
VESSATDANTEALPEPPVVIPNLERQISASLLRLRMRSPFFATLALFARFRATMDVPTAATDGHDVLYNPVFMGKLPTPQFDGVILHEVLHAALLHVPRRGHRDPQGWNIAADIVVNGILIENGFELPEGTIRDENLERYSVEEVYALLPRQEREYTLSMQDLLNEPQNGDDQDGEGKSNGKSRQREQPGQDGSLGQSRRAELESHWRQAAEQAVVIARMANQGKLPAGADRLLGSVAEARLDWRTLLWRYLTQTPTDFGEYDRRMVGRGLYIESLEGQSLRVYVAVDTSGSIDDAQVNSFVAELRGIMRAYPHVRCELYYADAAVYGPHDLTNDGELPTPQGGGGTDFRPFFDVVQTRLESHAQSACVYLTDGYGDFPETAPEIPTLWVVTPGGLDAESFPFGEVVKLIES